MPPVCQGFGKYTYLCAESSKHKARWKYRTDVTQWGFRHMSGYAIKAFIPWVRETAVATSRLQEPDGKLKVALACKKKSFASVMFCRNRLYIDMNILRHNKDKKVILFTSLLK